MINVQNVSVHYGERALFDGISFNIAERDRVGLVGRNGAGKSTLMKILAKQTNPDKGQVTRPSASTIGYLHQDMALPKGKTVLDETLTAFEEVLAIQTRLAELTHALETRTDYESDAYSDIIHEFSDLNERFTLLGGDTMGADAERILTGLGFKATDLTRLTDEFSGGWQMRVELAKMLLRRPNYLLLDEPTNHLDIEAILWLEDFLQTYEGAVVLISHDKAFLDAVTRRTVEIEMGNVYDYKASYSKYVEMRKERRELMTSAFENQQKKIQAMQSTIDRFKAKANKASMAQSMMKQLDRMDKLEMEDEDNADMRIKFPPSPRSGDVVAEAQDLSKAYGALSVLDTVSIQIDRGDRVAFVGQNGQGKTTLTKILAGIEAATSGKVKLGHNVHLGYYAQNQAEALPMDMTLLKTMEQNAPPEMTTAQLRAILGAFMFGGEDVDKKVKVLSGGERARLAMACLLLRPINLLVLDEPTNHLDMRSKDVLKRAIQAYDGTLIVVSHDRDFLTALTTRTIEFRDRHLYEHLGDLVSFLEKRKLEDMRELGKRSTLEAAAKQASNTDARQRENRDADRRVQAAEKRIATLEREIRMLEAEMEAPSFYGSSSSKKILAQYETTKRDLEAVMAEWEAALETANG